MAVCCASLVLSEQGAAGSGAVESDLDEKSDEDVAISVSVAVIGQCETAEDRYEADGCNGSSTDPTEGGNVVSRGPPSTNNDFSAAEVSCSFGLDSIVLARASAGECTAEDGQENLPEGELEL